MTSRADEEFRRHVGTALRSRRLALGLTQVEVGQRAEVSSNYVARLERGELCPSLVVAASLAIALEMPIVDLVPSVPWPRA